MPEFNSKRVLTYAAFGFLWAAILLGAFVVRRVVKELPPIASLDEYVPRLTTRILDKDGHLISEFYTERRNWVSLGEIPVDLQNGFIAVEDDRFFKHWGISPRGMIRAAVKNFLAGRVVQGGSTITQQLSKLIFLTQERTLGRKIRELLLALQLESRFSKEEILQMYLNQVYFGHGAYGAAAAARIFFGKPVQTLALHESALLAGLPRLPTYYSPFNYPERALTRRNTVLGRLREMKYITPAEEAAARKMPLGVLTQPVNNSQTPYFVEMIRQTLEAKYGNDLLYRGGLTITTTLDLSMQTSAEEVFNAAMLNFDKTYGKEAEVLRAKEKLALLKKTDPQTKEEVKISSTPMQVQGALLALDPKTGGIRAMIGGRDFAKSQFNRAIQAKRQPGSSFKPFTYLTALDNGFTSASTLVDEPVAFINNGHHWELVENAKDAYSIAQATAGLADDKVWTPKNYDGKYLGTITLRKAISLSRNIISVKLIYNVGPEKVVAWAKKLGIDSPLDAVLALGLGASVVDMREMVAAYATFANEGIYNPPYFIEKVTSFDGRILEKHETQQLEVIHPELNYLIINLLRAVVQEGTGEQALELKRPVAGKTGTTQDQRDVWFMGFTPDLACGAWMGYDDFSQLGRKIAASSVVVPWWTQFMNKALAGTPTKDFAIPSGIRFVKVDRASGLLALPTCPRAVLEAFREGTEPKEYCGLDHSEQPAPEPQVRD